MVLHALQCAGAHWLVGQLIQGPSDAARLEAIFRLHAMLFGGTSANDRAAPEVRDSRAHMQYSQLCAVPLGA